MSELLFDKILEIYSPQTIEWCLIVFSWIGILVARFNFNTPKILWAFLSALAIFGVALVNTLIAAGTFFIVTIVFMNDLRLGETKEEKF